MAHPVQFRFDDLRCVRNDALLFDSLSATLAGGELLALYGRNGAGKSSLLRMLAGLLFPQAGVITWNGEPIHASETFPIQRFFLGHGSLLKPELTVMEHCARWAKLQGEPMLIDAALHYFDLGWARDVPCKRLSAGWQRRVELARLLYQPAMLWLLDEPLVHLDKEGEALLASLCGSRLQQGGIIVMSSHSPVGGVPNIKEITLHASPSQMEDA